MEFPYLRRLRARAYRAWHEKVCRVTGRRIIRFGGGAVRGYGDGRDSVALGGPSVRRAMYWQLTGRGGTPLV